MSDHDERRPEVSRDVKDSKDWPQGKSLEEWIKGWHRWFLGIPEARHPTLTNSPKERLQDQDQEDPRAVGMASFLKSDARRVWFLAGGYGGLVNTRSFVPTGKFYILAPVFTVFASEEEGPPEFNSTARLLTNFAMKTLNTHN